MPDSPPPSVNEEVENVIDNNPDNPDEVYPSIINSNPEPDGSVDHFDESVRLLHDESLAEIPTESTEISAIARVTNGEVEHDVDDSCVTTFTDFDAEEGDENGDDIVNVIIKPTGSGNIYKTGATYQARSSVHTSQYTKATKQGIELDDPGDLRGVPTIEFNLSSLGDEDKPWKRPGADITDYFNYGFTEETWIQYCEKQKILRQQYANATIKPILATGGTGLLHRMRSAGSSTGIRSYDNSKSSNINVVNLSSSNRGLLSGLHSKISSNSTTGLLNGVSSFTQPPPGYPTPTSQTDAFIVPSLGFPSASQLLAGGSATSGLFPNLAMPPPVMGNQLNWQGAVHGLLAAGEAVIDPATGQITSILEHSRRSPESVYSNDDRSSRRRSRHHMDDGSYMDRESYRSRRRSRSGSRDHHHSRSKRNHRDSDRSDRDYDRRSSRRSHRSRDRSVRDDRYGGGQDELLEMDDFHLPTSAGVRSERRSDRSAREYGRSSRSSRERSGHRSSHHHHREHDRSSRSSRSTRHKSRSRSPYRRDLSRSPGGATQPSDPMEAASVAAANIALALGASQEKANS